MTKPVYYDNRSEFWKRHWEMAIPYDEFVETDPETGKRWKDIAERLPPLSDEQLARLQDYNRIVNVLMYGGVWCMDCARQGPIIRQISDVCGNSVNLRIIDRDTSEELKDELRILGATRVPIVVFLSEDFWEVDRFGDRTLTVYRSKAARDIGRGTDGGIMSPKGLQAQVDEWSDMFERVLIMLRLAPPLRRRYND
jgi:hypothetical protein